MSNTQILFAAAGVVVSLIVALWGITAGYTNRLIDQSDRNTTRLIEQFDKRMQDRDEKLLARIDALDAKLSGQIEVVRFELKAEIGELRGELVGALRSDVEQLKDRVAQLERRAA